MGWASDAFHNDIMRASGGLIATGALTVHTSEGTLSRSGFTPRSESYDCTSRKSTNHKSDPYSQLQYNLKYTDLSKNHKSVILDIMKSYYSIKNIKNKRSVKMANSYRSNLERIVDNTIMKSINIDTGEYETITECQLNAVKCIYYWTYSPVFISKYDYSKYRLKDEYLRYAMPLVHAISECEKSENEFDLDTYVNMYKNNKYNLI